MTTRIPTFQRTGYLLVAWLVSRAAVAVPLLSSPSGKLNGGDLLLYRGWARQIFAGHPPGLSSPWQYPPGALLPIGLPGLVTTGPSYPVVFIGLQLLIDAAFLLLLLRQGRRWHLLATEVRVGENNDRRGRWTPRSWGSGPGTAGAWAWVVLGGVFTQSTLTRIDLASSLPALAALCAGPTLGGALLAVGFGIKGWPVVLLPVLIIRHGRSGVARIAAGFAGSTAVTAVLLLATGTFGNATSFLRFQQHRGVEIEAFGALGTMWSRYVQASGMTFWDPVALVRKTTGGINPVAWNHISLTYEAAGAGGTARNVLCVSLICGGLALFLGMRAARVDPRRAAGLTGVAVLCAVLAGDRVLSPQYLMWLIVPVVWLACCPGQVHRPVFVFAGVAVALTQIEYPYNWSGLVNGTLGPLLLLTARDVALTACGIAAARGLWLLQPPIQAATSGRYRNRTSGNAKNDNPERLSTQDK